MSPAYHHYAVRYLSLHFTLPHCSLQPRLFPLSFFTPSLTQLFPSASGVDPLILAWHRGKDTDGTHLVNLICKSESCLFVLHVYTFTTIFSFPFSASFKSRGAYVRVRCEMKFGWGCGWAVRTCRTSSAQTQKASPHQLMDQMHLWCI